MEGTGGHGAGDTNRVERCSLPNEREISVGVPGYLLDGRGGFTGELEAFDIFDEPVYLLIRHRWWLGTHSGARDKGKSRQLPMYVYIL